MVALAGVVRSGMVKVKVKVKVKVEIIYSLSAGFSSALAPSKILYLFPSYNFNYLFSSRSGGSFPQSCDSVLPRETGSYSSAGSLQQA